MIRRIAHGLPDADRLLVVMSDIEMGAGGPADDFPDSDFLGDLILGYNEPPYDQLNVDLVFNGDTFDLLKTSYLNTYPRHITRDVAMGKMSRVSEAHPLFFKALRRFLDHKDLDRRVHFVVGNHDPELFFPEVQEQITSLCGSQTQVFFPGMEASFGKVHIEHGSQRDHLFRIDPDNHFAHYNGNEVLHISWGAAALLDTVIPLQSLLHFYDRLKPRKLLFELMPEIRELLLSMFWKYWTHDYWQGYFKSGDPTKDLTWSMVKELAWRFRSQDPTLNIGHSEHTQLERNDRYMLYLVGHLHQPAWWSYGDRKLMQTGCLRNEYMVTDNGKILRPIVKSFAEVFLRGDIPVISHLVEMEGLPPPPDYVPNDLFAVLPKVRALLATGKERAKLKEAQLEQERREAEERGKK